MVKPMTYFAQIKPGIVILKKQEDGCFYWVGTSKDLQSAKDRVHALMEFFPAEYLILNQRMGEKIAILPPDGEEMIDGTASGPN
jgi:hypothetical protein